MSDHYEFQLKPLPYTYDALEPYIDRETVMIHHDRHQKAYVDNLNKILSGYPQFQSWTLTELLTSLGVLPPEIRTGVTNQGGGVYNHELYWESMTPGGGGRPSGSLASAIDQEFGSFDSFKEKFSAAAAAVFGSGWVFLAMDPNGGLQIYPTKNQDTPLACGLCPILNLDVWEHAYYLKYQNLRPDYIKNWWNLVNWKNAEEFYQCCRAWV